MNWYEKIVFQGRSWPSNWNWGRFWAATTTATIRKLMRAFLTSFPPPLTVLVTVCYRCYTFVTLLERSTTFHIKNDYTQGLVEFHGAQGRNVDYAQLMKILFNPFALWDFGKLDAVVRGNAQQCPRKIDTSFSIQVDIIKFIIIEQSTWYILSPLVSNRLPITFFSLRNRIMASTCLP